ncbi:MAG: AraC family transcriptional regulator [Capsulimonadales bacterium]|nr:AraC family transcriptional regulator [Capsulimonadales bacterium]
MQEFRRRAANQSHILRDDRSPEWEAHDSTERDLMLRQRFDITLYRIETAAYSRLDLRGERYPHWIVSHVLEGDVLTEAAGLRFSVAAGQVMLHPPHLTFSEFAVGPGVHQWMLFDATLGDPPTDLFLRWPVTPVVDLGGRRQAFSASFEELRAAIESSTADLRVNAGMAFLLQEVIAAWQTAGSPTRPAAFDTGTHRFSDLLLFMETHLSGRLTRDDLAARVHLHPGYFDRAFRAVCGIPPMKMLQRMRLARARRLLETTDETLETIAGRTGLGDAARLSRLFRAQYGRTPGAVRAEFRELRQVYISPPAGPELRIQ